MEGGEKVQNKGMQEDCNAYAGNLEEETAFLMQDQNAAEAYTNNTPVLTIFCC